jgi:hypothetical protein
MFSCFTRGEYSSCLGSGKKEQMKGRKRWEDKVYMKLLLFVHQRPTHPRLIPFLVSFLC